MTQGAFVINEERFEQMEQQVGDMHKLLVGNGEMGALNKVDIMWRVSIRVGAWVLVISTTTNVGIVAYVLFPKLVEALK